MNINFKILTKRFFLINLTIVTLLTIGLSVYDPLHLFHKSWITEKDRIHGDMRMQAAGIINHYDFDSIIVGTSMLKGTSAILASSKLGGKFANLSPNGASISERKYIVNYALEKKNIKNVIISFDTGLDQNLIISNKKFPVKNYDFLYDGILVNDMKAYWNYKFIECFLRFSTSSKCLGNKRDLQKTLSYFDKLSNRNKSISGIENWLNHKKGRGKAINSRIKRHLNRPLNLKKYKEKLNITKQIIDKNLISLVASNHNTNFHIIFPPYSRFLYSLWKQKNPYKYLLYKDTLRYLVIKGTEYKNFKIYSFDGMEYLDDLDNYRDMRHYNTDMNETMLVAIRDQSNIISRDNITSFLEKIDTLNSSYDLDLELNHILNNY
jgi:hypothetical protein